MSTHEIALASIAAYLVCVTLIGWLGRSVARDSDMFNIFGRRAKAVRATAGYLSLIGGGELITISQLGYDNGWSVFWFLGGIAIGFATLSVSARRVKAIADERKINTLTGFYADQHGAAAGLAATTIFVLSLGSLLTIQFIVGSQLLSALFHVPEWLTILLIGGVITLYLVPAGIVAVLSTDVLRAVMMTVFLVAVVYFTAEHVGYDVPLGAVSPLPQPDGAVYLILGFFGAVAAADVWQTVLASKDSRVLRISLLSGAAAFLAVGALIAKLGMITRAALPHLGASQPAFIEAAAHVIPGALAPLVAVLVTGSVMATADTEIWVITTLVLSNLRPSFANKLQHGYPRQSDDLKRATRLLLPIVCAFAMGAAYISSNAQAIYTGLLSLLSASGVAILACLFLSPTGYSIAFSLWAGIASFAALSYIYSFNIPLLISLMPLAFAAVGYAVGSCFARRVAAT